MAGRPKTSARLVTNLEERALGLAADVFRTQPAMYRERPDSTDPISAAWAASVEAAMQVSLALERLADLLRGRAELTKPGPCRRLLEEPQDIADGLEAADVIPDRGHGPGPDRAVRRRPA